MRYLILGDAVLAAARSAAAYAALPPAGEVVTSAAWTWRVHPADGRAVLEIPDTPAEAGLGLTAAAYDGLLTEDERADLLAVLPPEGWDRPTL